MEDTGLEIPVDLHIASQFSWQMTNGKAGSKTVLPCLLRIVISTAHTPKTADDPVVHLQLLNIYDPTIGS